MRISNPFRSDTLGDPHGLATWMMVLAFAVPWTLTIILWLFGAF
jgi:hypothetical protein